MNRVSITTTITHLWNQYLKSISSQTMARRTSCFKAMMVKSCAIPKNMDRIWWWLAIASIVALLGQEIVRTSALAMAAASSSDFEGFGDEWEEAETEDEPVDIVVPPPSLHRRAGVETERGPPVAEQTPEATPETLIETVEAAPKTHAKHEIWDEDEFEGLPEEDPVFLGTSSPSDPSPPAASAPPSTPVPRQPQNYYIEIACIGFLVAFGVAYFLGKKENEKVALIWASHFAGKDSIFEKNFSLLGIGSEPDSPLLAKEGQNIFKFYASGRRFCKGLLATMDLQCRHDLITCLWYLVSPKKDEITIEVFMNDENMDPITFAIVRKKHSKAMLKDWKDLQTYASVQSLRKGLSEELVLISESRDLASDLLTETVLDQVFGEKAFEKFGRYFVSLHFSDEFPLGSQKKILQFKFVMPPPNKMGDMSRLIALVPYYIDLVARYKLNTQLRSKAEAARAKVAQEAFKEAQLARQEALQKRKEERRKALESAESRVSTEVLRKREEKERARQMKKAMPRVKMTRA